MEISKDLHVGNIFTSRWAKFSHKLVKSHLGTKFITSSALHISLVFVEILDEILSFNTNALFEFAAIILEKMPVIGRCG